MKTKLVSVFAAIATIVATVLASSACFLFSYQPEEPRCLREE